MTVVVLMPLALQRGGGELMLWHLMKYTRDLDVEWVVIFFENGPLVSEFRELGIETRVVTTKRLRNIGQYIKAVAQIADIASSKSADLIFSWAGKPHLYGSPASKLARIPAAWYQLGAPTGRHLSWVDRVATALPAECVVTLSEFASEQQEQLWPRRSTRLVYPSVDLDRFDPTRLPTPEVLRKKLGLPGDGTIIGMVGRLQRWKGMHTLIESMPRILSDHPDAHAVIVGGGHDMEPDYPAMLRRLIARLGIEKHVTICGFRTNVPEWMMAMDVVVHASDHEPFGIVVIEAMALGKAVVAGESGGPSEIITDEVNGLLAPYGDATKLAKQVLRYLNNSEFGDRVGRAAIRRAQDFSGEAYADRLVKTLYAIV